NVITPGLKDDKNDFLTTYPKEDIFREDCSRSLKHVDIRIYSRWGQEIFTRSLTADETPVFWNGRTNEGKEAGSGVYFYQATVIFDTNEPSRQKQEFKGWIRLIR
ncbi:MAG TPA: gliding motility-associated C-terminal domain-containing protein, partial [Chryseosolibacter sp.]